MYMATLGPPRPFKTYEFYNFRHFWMREALSNVLTSIVSNSHSGKRPGTRDMTIFGSHVGPRNIHR